MRLSRRQQETAKKASLKTLGSQLWTWINSNILDLGRQMRLSYLPPLMVYMAAGLAGLTGIVGTFFVKDYLGLSAEFLTFHRIMW
jgi:hypothetical protein